MRHSFKVLAASAALAVAGAAQAAVIPVGNGSFETGTYTDPGYQGNDAWYSLPASAPGVWEYTGTASKYGQYKVDTTATGGGAHFWSAADGDYVLNFVNDPTITQTLSSYTVASGDVFTLDFYVAKARTGSGTGTLTASILVGGISIATDATFATTVAAGAWDHKTLTGTATGTGALKISFAPNTDSPWLDNVTMSVGVPEPAALSLVGLSGIALLGRRRRA